MQFLVFCSIPVSPGTVSSCMGKLARDMVVRMETTDRELQASYVQIGDVYRGFFWIPELPGWECPKKTLSFEIWKSIVCVSTIPYHFSSNWATIVHGFWYMIWILGQQWSSELCQLLRPTTMPEAQFRCSLPTTSPVIFSFLGKRLRRLYTHDGPKRAKVQLCWGEIWFFELPHMSNFIS